MTNRNIGPAKPLSRRSFLATASIAALALGKENLFAFTSTSPSLVHTANGVLRGETDQDVRVFRGVPFAEPPVGSLRFRPPVKAKSWEGERDATSFAAAAMQPTAPQVPQSEDCLYLNVWAPAGKGPFPVYVWIHGGGFTGGHAFEPVYDGTSLAREGIVCITVAYRLGVFGFLDMEPLLGPEYAGTGDNALRDLILSLEWVQENVAAFGGDPARVTIGGESAGAKLTDILMGTPSAQPLFHQMISESGGAERVWPQPTAAAIASGYGKQWRDASAQPLSSLLTAPAASLIDAQRTFVKQWPQHFPLRPEINASLLPQLPVKTIASGSTHGKRLLIGTNRDESALFVGPKPPTDATAAELGNLPLAGFNEIYLRYKDVYPQMTAQQRLIRALTAEEYWIPSIRVVDAHMKGGGEAWMYRLDFAETSGRLRGFAYHSLDVGLVWDKPHAKVENASAEAALALQMHLAWSAFIRGETPAAQGLPAWPGYSSDTRPTMIFDVKSRLEERPQEAELRLWDDRL